MLLILGNCMGGVMVSVLNSHVVNGELEPQDKNMYLLFLH